MYGPQGASQALTDLVFQHFWKLDDMIENVLFFNKVTNTLCWLYLNYFLNWCVDSTRWEQDGKVVAQHKL